MNNKLVEKIKVAVRITSDDVFTAKITLPVILLLWIPITLAVTLSIFYHIRWDYFGIIDDISPFYTKRFKSSYDSYMWIISEIGWVGMIMFSLCSISYLWMTRQVIIGIFYRR
ncbi:MAG: hypothetical protein AABY22_02885 [Nanoarchaeota archaeon]